MNMSERFAYCAPTWFQFACFEHRGETWLVSKCLAVRAPKSEAETVREKARSRVALPFGDVIDAMPAMAFVPLVDESLGLVRIGKAYIAREYFEFVTAELPGANWHSSGPDTFVYASLGGAPVAVIGPMLQGAAT